MKYFLILLLLAATALARPAHAEPSAADRTTARRLAIEGQVALKKGDFDTAADRFERANELVPAPSILVRLARSRVGQGRLVEAYEIYRTIIREGVTPDQPEAFKRALAEAKQEVTLVEPRLAWVSVNVVGADPSAVEVTLNGSLIPSAALGAQRPVDPGLLKARAKAEGYHEAEAEVQLAEGQHLPALELRMVPLPKPQPAIVEVTPAQPMMSSDGGEPSFISQTTLAYVALGLGGAGLAIGGATGIIAMDRHSAVSELPCEYVDDQGKCRITDGTPTAARLRELRHDFDTFATAATAGFIAGGALAATGLILLLTAPDEEGSSEQSKIQPYVGLGYLGATGTF